MTKNKWGITLKNVIITFFNLRFFFMIKKIKTGRLLNKS